MVFLQNISTAPRKVRFFITAERWSHCCISRAHWSPVGAWKQASGQAKCISISLMTSRGGRLLKTTKALSKRNIHKNVLRLY